MNFPEKERRVAQAGSAYIKMAILIICAVIVFSSMILAVFNRIYIGDNGLYVNGAPTVFLVILALISIAACVFGTMNVRRALKLDSVPDTGDVSLPMLSVLMAADFFAMFIIYFMLGAVDLQYGFGGSIDNSPELAEKMKTAILCYKLLVPLSLFAPIYFIVAAFKKKISALFGSITLVWIILYVLRLYFDVTDWVMSPRKLTMICAMCIAALFILYEIRFAFSRGSSRKYFFFAALAATFCFCCGFAGVFSIISGVYPVNYELPYYSICLLIGVYALVRVLSFISSGMNENDYDDYLYDNDDEYGENIEQSEDNEPTQETEQI